MEVSVAATSAVAARPHAALHATGLRKGHNRANTLFTEILVSDLFHLVRSNKLPGEHISRNFSNTMNTLASTW